MNWKRYHMFQHKVLFSVLFFLGAWSALVHAQGLTHQAAATNAPQVVNVSVGSSLIIDSPVRFTRASIATPEIADTLILSTKQIYLTGKKVGTTTLTLWGKKKQVSNVFEVQVTPDLTRLKTQLHEVFPHETDIQVTASHDGITLSGTVSSTEVLAKVLEIARPYAPDKIVNVLQVGGVHQVMLEVTVAEMSRSLTRQLGFNFVQFGGDNFFFGTLNDLHSFTTDANGLTTIIPAAATDAFIGFPGAGSAWRIILAYLKEHNLTKVLAEPTLMAISGQEAQFLAGGEFPIPIPQAFGVTTIQFKEFGVRLGFNPLVLNDKKISLKISPEVSALDFAGGINENGFTIPAFVTRRASTILELGDGQSFAIAGLLQDNVVEAVAKYPVLGDIPVLGALFRSTRFQKDETELIIIVTPRLVKPLDLAKQTLPTDFYLEPNDFELLLLGYIEGVPPKVESPSSGLNLRGDSSGVPLGWQHGGLEGVFGHLAPAMKERRP